VTWQIPQLYLYSIHILLRILRVTVDIAALILPASSGKVLTNGDMYMVSLKYFQNKEIKQSKVS
jgi:hypothetical protein